MDTIRGRQESAAAAKLDPATVCSLSSDDLNERLAWIQREILPHARATERLESAIAWELDAVPGLVEKLDQLISLERRCCGEIVFERMEGSVPGRLRLEVRGIDPDAPLFRSLQGS